MKSEKRLWDIMIEAITDETGLAGVPFAVVEKRISEQADAAGISADRESIESMIQKGLDEWVIDKTIDELSYQRMRELGLPEESGFIWHLKVLTPAKTESYKQLAPEVKALIRLLREQNDPQTMGTIPKEVAIQKLIEQGFSDDLKHIYAEDLIEDFIGGREDDCSIWYYGLVKEYEKTEEYKAWHQEVLDKAAEREAFRYRMTEENEVIDCIYTRLKQLATKRKANLKRLREEKKAITKEQHKSKRKRIDRQDQTEKRTWNQIIERVHKLSFGKLIELRILVCKTDKPCTASQALEIVNEDTKKDV